MREFSLIGRSRIAILLGNSRYFLGYGVFLRKFYLGILNSALGILEFINSRCPLGFAVEAEKTREF